MQPIDHAPRRQFLKAAAGTGLALAGSGALAQAFDFKPHQRYPDPAIQIFRLALERVDLAAALLHRLGLQGAVAAPAAPQGSRRKEWQGWLSAPCRAACG